MGIDQPEVLKLHNFALRRGLTTQLTRTKDELAKTKLKNQIREERITEMEKFCEEHLLPFPEIWDHPAFQNYLNEENPELEQELKLSAEQAVFVLVEDRRNEDQIKQQRRDLVLNLFKDIGIHVSSPNPIPLYGGNKIEHIIQNTDLKDAEDLLRHQVKQFALHFKREGKLRAAALTLGIMLPPVIPLPRKSSSKAHHQLWKSLNSDNIVMEEVLDYVV